MNQNERRANSVLNCMHQGLAMSVIYYVFVIHHFAWNGYSSIIKCNNYVNFDFYTYIATKLSFEQPSYSVDESGIEIQLLLVLSKPRSTNITIQVIEYELTAMSKLYITHLKQWISNNKQTIS